MNLISSEIMACSPLGDVELSKQAHDKAVEQLKDFPVVYEKLPELMTKTRQQAQQINSLNKDYRLVSRNIH